VFSAERNLNDCVALAIFLQSSVERGVREPGSLAEQLTS
jgi:hypothetical protein